MPRGSHGALIPMPMKPAPTLRLGTSSWSCPGWVGPFYPPGLPAAEFLGHYAREFSTVEADVTYYRIPSRSMVDGWYQRTPADFILSAKFPRSIVHGGRGPRPDPEIVLVPDAVRRDSDLFVERMSGLAEKLGPLVLQFPYFNRRAFPSNGPFLERLDAYLAALPAQLRIAVELRNRAWLDDELLELLRSHGAALVLVDLSYLPHPARLAENLDLVSADFLYCRLIGDRQATEAKTKKFDQLVIDQTTRLDDWGRLLHSLAPRVKETYAYANNHYAGHGPTTARQLGELLAREA